MPVGKVHMRLDFRRCSMKRAETARIVTDSIQNWCLRADRRSKGSINADRMHRREMDPNRRGEGF